MPKEQRTKYYRENHQLMGDSLKAAIKETISESQRNTDAVEVLVEVVAIVMLHRLR